MDKLTQLKQKIDEVQTKSLVANDMRAFIKLVLEVIKKSKDEFNTLSSESKQTIQQALDYIESEHSKLKDNVTQETSKAKKDFDVKLAELNKLVKELKSVKYKDGENGQDGDDGYTPIKGLDYFTEKEIKDIKEDVLKYIPEIKGEKIVLEINSLPLDEDKKIDAKHIKNLPTTNQVMGFRGISQVYHDETLTGLGTQSEPLKVANDVNAVWGQISGDIANQTDLTSNFLKLNQTTPQTTVGRFTFPALTVDTNTLFVDNVNHRVGIGTNNPGQILDISKSSSGGIGAILNLSNLATTALNNAVELRFAPSDSGAVRYSSIQGINNGSNGISLAFVTGAGSVITEKMRLDLYGALGLGTTAPGYKLDVFGGAATDGVRSTGGFDVNLVSAPTAPTYTLSAGGSVDAGVHYYFVTYTTAVGETSAGSLLTSVVTAGNNTVNLTIPVSTDTRVTGRKIYRTKVGGTSDNEYLLATIADNTSTTYVDTTADSSLTGQALQYYRVNSTSKYISINGTRVMIIDTNLVALGKNAGQTLMGNYAPVRTVLVGPGAGQNITTGTSNVVLGVTGTSLTTGGSNTLLGDLAGILINTGSSNVVIGGQAGRYITTSSNTVIGADSGKYLNDGTTQLTAPTYSTYLGYGARGSAANESNAIVIGYNALGLGSNTVVLGNSSITKTALFGNVGIGTTSPGYKFETIGANAGFNSTDYLVGVSGSTLRFTMGLQATGYTAIDSFITGRNSYANLVFNTSGGNVGIGTTSPDTKLQVVGDVKIGEDTTNYAQFGTDGTLRLYGTATVFDDLLGDITGVKTLGTSVSVNAAESTLEYVAAANTSDYAYFNYQLSHKWKIGSVVHPHIHFEQNKNVIPNWLIQYRWQVQGQAKTTAWTNYKTIVPTFTYTTGTLNQIVHDSGITPPAGASLSDIIEIRIIRDTANTSGLFTGADTYTGVASITSADIHYEMDALGSNNEYTK